MFELRGRRVWVAGHRGMVGSAIWRRLETRGGVELIGWTSEELDLTDRHAALDAAAESRPDVVVLAAAKVGGIVANVASPIDFLAENLRIQTNVMEAAEVAGVDRLLFLASSCIYPRDTEQPMSPSQLWTGPLEPTNESYAVAKLAGIRLVEAYRVQRKRAWISCLPTNVYGPGDDFDLRTAHVLAALIRRFDEAVRDETSTVTLWGSGRPRRELLHVDDLAAACVRLLEVYDGGTPINVGTGEDVSIAELATLVARVVGYSGEIAWDTTKPDGMPKKLLEVSAIQALGWEPTIGLASGVRSMWAWYRDQIAGTTETPD